MTKKTAAKHMCPLSAAREKVFGCRCNGCAAWRLYAPQGRPVFVDGEPLHYCGQVGEPKFAQFALQFPERLADDAPPAPDGPAEVL